MLTEQIDDAFLVSTETIDAGWSGDPLGARVFHWL
jgi:hypothetical protein